MIRTEAVRRAIEAEINLAYARGFERSFKEAFERSFKEAFERSFKEAFEQGRKETALECVDNTLRLSDLPADMIAKCANLPLETVREREIIIRGK